MGSNFCVPLVMNEMFSALLNFDVFNRAYQRNCTATFAKAAIGIGGQRRYRGHAGQRIVSLHSDNFSKICLFPFIVVP